MKQQDPLKTVNALLSGDGDSRVLKSDYCCGEAGTLAVARPDISTQVRFRKEEEMQRVAGVLRQDFDGPVKVLTSCPACLQGLQRYQDDVKNLDADYIVVEMARRVLGENWLPTFVEEATQGGIERILL